MTLQRIPVSELDENTDVSPDAVVHVVQDGTSKKATVRRLVGIGDFATIADMAASTKLTDGEYYTASSAFNGEPETFLYDADSALTADGALVVDATGMGAGRLVSTRTVFVDIPAMLADVRTFADGVWLTLVSGGAKIVAVSSGETDTNAGGQKLNILESEDYATRAQKWAEEAEDVEVETGEYSALHHAAKANADATQTALDRVATAADVATSAGHVSDAEAARDAAISAGAWDYTPIDGTDSTGALGDITGMVDGETALVLDTMHVWEYDGADWIDTGESPLASKADKNLLYGIAQELGPATPDMDAGTGSASGSTAFWYVNPVAVTDDCRVRFTCYMNAAGTVRLLSLSKDGDDYTVEGYVEVETEIGLNSFTVADLDVQPGWHLGFAAGVADIAIQAGTDETTGGYYSDFSEGWTPDVSDTLTDAVSSDLIFMARFDIEVAYATGAYIKPLSDSVDSTLYTLGLAGDDQIVGRPLGSTLVTGSASGASHYILTGAADGRRRLEAFDIWATSAGIINVGGWSEDESGDLTRERFVPLTVEVGLNQFTFDDIGLIIMDGEELGFDKGTAGIALTTDGSNPTPYRSVNSTSGTPSAGGASVRFEIIATLSPDSLPDRVSRVEEAQAASDTSLLDTHTYHAIWMLGESHVAGRGATLSDAVIPSGGGYVYRRAAGEMIALADPTGNDSTAIASGGKGSWGPAAGRALLDATNGAIGAAIVNSGLGSSTAVTHWASGGSGWTQAKADWTDAKSEMDSDGKSLCGCSVVIAIGSNDAVAGTTKAVFKAAFIDLIDRVRVELGYDVPILILPTGPFSNGDYATEVAYIQAAQHEIAKEETNVRLITTATEYASENGWFLDNVHFIQVANEVIGAALGVTSFAVGSGGPV